MTDADRYKLFYSPYECPRCSVGDKVLNEYRDRMVVVGMTDAPIQWPARKSPRRPSTILVSDLIRAVETESEIAVAHHYLNLCSEEFHLKEDEYLSPEVWDSGRTRWNRRCGNRSTSWAGRNSGPQFESYTPFLQCVDRVQCSGGA